MTGSRERTHDLVVRWVEDELAAGRLPVGSRLPPERTLAEQLEVSRASVREGLRVLEVLGVIRTSVGRGPEAGATLVAEAADGFAVALRLHLAASSLPVSDVVDTRIMIESWCARQAATRRDDAHLAVAAAVLDEMDALGPGGAPLERFHELDGEFHAALARATGNELIAIMMSALRQSIRHYISDAAPAVPDWGAMSRRLRRQHRNILAAIVEGDGDRAARLVAAHITGYYRATYDDARTPAR